MSELTVGSLFSGIGGLDPEPEWDGSAEGDPGLHDVLNRALDKIEETL